MLFIYFFSFGQVKTKLRKCYMRYMVYLMKFSLFYSCVFYQFFMQFENVEVFFIAAFEHTI